MEPVEYSNNNPGITRYPILSKNNMVTSIKTPRLIITGLWYEIRDNGVGSRIVDGHIPFRAPVTRTYLLTDQEKRNQNKRGSLRTRFFILICTPNPKKSQNVSTDMTMGRFRLGVRICTCIRLSVGS